MYRYFCILDEAQSMESSIFSSHNNADSLYFPLTTSVEHIQSQYIPHADIHTQNTTQSGDNSQSEGSQDSVSEMSEDVVTETDTVIETSLDEPSDNTSKILLSHLCYPIPMLCYGKSEKK